jgi:hypothetical protein
MGSLQSIYTPYPPTVDNQHHQRRPRKDSASERDSAFLEKLLENLKNGIIEQMDSKMTELRNQIPTIIQETQDQQRSRRASSQGLPQMMAQNVSHIPSMGTQVQQPPPMALPMSFNPNYLGSCF